METRCYMLAFTQFINTFVKKIQNSKLAKDSFWAIFGNGLGSGLLLIAGMLIARKLGSDVYGEYGVVKSTMFTIGAFASCGLGVTATKFVAEAESKKSENLKSLIYCCLLISLVCSSLLALILLIFSRPLAIWLDSEQLAIPFRFLAIIVILRATNMTQRGILGGLKLYSKVAKNSVISGFIMLIICVPLTLLYNLWGALIALTLSEMVNCMGNYISIKKYVHQTDWIVKIKEIKEIAIFSIPVALQECTYFVSQWGGVLLLTKFSTMVEVGLYSASAQWNSIILFIPGVLYNVVISHLSSNTQNTASQIAIMKRMLAANLISTFVPFVIIWTCARWISMFYGPSFVGMGQILTVLTCSTIFSCCSNVFRGQFVANGKNWVLLIIRCIRDLVLLVSSYYLIKYNAGENGGVYYAWCNLITGILYFFVLLLWTVYFIKRKN